jgi:hypothetical protein
LVIAVVSTSRKKSRCAPLTCWEQLPHDGGKAAVGNGVHFGFLAGSVDVVRAFHARAPEMGGACDGSPGLRQLYGPQ